MSEELTVYESKPLTANDIKAQVDLIQEVMKKVMRDKEHYGVIPGCGDKPALLKPGAEKLNLTFRMAPDPETEIIDLGGGHREYRVKCIMRSIATGTLLGAGVGSASTMETKWRFRAGPVEFTGKAVPKEYWDGRDIALLGGRGFAAKKNPETGQWEIARQGEKVEHDNPADYYNTCWKMAKKRALVDAVLTVTAASDIFTQDIEEMAENGVALTAEKPPTAAKSPIQEPQKKTPPVSSPPNAIKTPIYDVELKEGKGAKGHWTKYTLSGVGHDGNEIQFSTFDKKLGELAVRERGTGLLFEIEWERGQYGNTIKSMVPLEAPPLPAPAQQEDIPF